MRLILQPNQCPITQLIALKRVTLLGGNKYPHVRIWCIIWCNSGIVGKVSNIEADGLEVRVPYQIVTDEGEGHGTRWLVSGNYIQQLNIWRRGRSNDP